MAFRNILVPVDDTVQSAERVRSAAAFAARHAATLTGAGFRSEFLQTLFGGDAIGYMSPADIDKVIKDHRRAVDEALEKARMAFEASAQDAGAVSDWRILNGSDTRELVAAARRTDLCVLSPKMAPALCDYSIFADAVGLASGGPILVVPDGAPGPQIGRRVVIAWNGSREAARALRDAMPLLFAAEAVTIAIVAPKGEGGPDHGLQKHLESHGIHAAIVENRSEDHAAAEVLTEEIRRAEADLLVMGLYGRSRLHESVLGGVSRAMLKKPPVPLFMSH